MSYEFEFNGKLLVELFKRYGFDYKGNSSGNGFYAFTYKSGFFHNAEFVYIKSADRVELENKQDELKRLGFSTKLSLFTSMEEIENTLFTGFFDVVDWIRRIKKEYVDYCNKIISMLPDDSEQYEYNYIHVPFVKLYNESKWMGSQSEQSIIDSVLSEIISDKAKLIIIEAPAGFGKTCTSYEILNKLVEDESKKYPIPFFTEFSRDRQAKIFDHIFVREVDRSFNSVKSELVIRETQNGRIVLVLDGFDELLNDAAVTESDADYENAQPMLETIGDLLTDKAKVILTSRRTAMFDGEVFNEWKEKYKDNFSVVRYKLTTPKITDWLPDKKINKLEQKNINISHLSNPVLLSYLRSLKMEFFNDVCESDDIIDYYFNSMLEREQERQNLLMKPAQQALVLKSIAHEMSYNDYTSDEKEEVVKTIKNKNTQLLEETRKLYSIRDRPTIEALAHKLATHAFLDRSNQGENRIEFVNEFVLGNYVACDVIDHSNDWIASERFADSAVRAYYPRAKTLRELLWSKLEDMRILLTATDHMKYESLLLQKVDEHIDEKYSNDTITGVEFESICFFKESLLNNSVFNECTFLGCMFDFKNFNDVTFLSCSFYDCTFNFDDLPFDISFLNCTSNNNFVSCIEGFDNSNYKSEKKLEHKILETFFPQSSSSIPRLHAYTNNLYKISGYTKRDITKAIKNLKNEGFLEDANNSSFVAINKDRLSDIKRILGK